MRRKKNIRFRGSKTHGWGSMKKHRGAGHRGGRGNAGSGKKGDGKKPSVWKKYKGGKDPSKRGFKIRDTYKTINVGHLSSVAQQLILDNQAKETQGSIVIDLRELGIMKLLGGGQVKHKLKIAVTSATPKAKDKLEKAGGTLDAVVVDKEAVKVAREEKKKTIKKKIPKNESKEDEPKGEAVKTEVKEEKAEKKEST